MLFIEYSKCSTCKNAEKFLKDNNIDFTKRSIIDETPTKEELKNWIEKYNIDIKKLFNTSGLVYKNHKLKEKLPNMTDTEKLKLLSSNGMLIKRPLLISDDKILIGYKEKEYNCLVEK